MLFDTVTVGVPVFLTAEIPQEEFVQLPVLTVLPVITADPPDKAVSIPAEPFVALPPPMPDVTVLDEIVILAEGAVLFIPTLSEEVPDAVPEVIVLPDIVSPEPAI